MKNKKTILGSSAAIVASVALIGGGTFAAWSDFDVISENTSGAGELVLDVNNPNGTQEGFEVGNLTPGEFQDFEVFVASTNSDAVPDAELYMTLTDLQGQEDGCTSASEGTNVDGSTNDIDCDDTNTAGEFISQADMQVGIGKPSAGGGCNVNGAGFLALADFGGSQVAFLDAAEGQRLNLTRFTELQGDGSLAALDPGEELCARVRIRMPDLGTSGLNNQSQGDSATFSLLFEADQIVGSGGGNGHFNNTQ